MRLFAFAVRPRGEPPLFLRFHTLELAFKCRDNGTGTQAQSQHTKGSHWSHIPTTLPSFNLWG